MQIRLRAILIGALVTLPLTAHAQTFPGADWQRKTPAEAGINPQLLKDAIDFAIASEIKNPRNLKLNHYRTFGREPFGDAIGPIKDRGEVTGVISDPVKSGLVASLNRPGGNVTGTTFYSVGLAAKRLELLHELVPNARVVAVLVQHGSVIAEEQETGLEKAADALGLRLLVLPVSGERDLEPAFAKFVAEGAGALVVTASAFFTSQREKIVALAAQHRIPAIYARQEHAAAGGLISYAANVAHMYRRAGVYAGLILNGAKPADLPVELPTKFELVINLKVAKALGVNIPDKVLALADEVIE